MDLSDSFASKLEREDLKAVFNLIDINGDGSISASEFKHLMKSFGKAVSDDEIDKIMQSFDADGNGVVCFEEFLALMGSQDLSEEIELKIAFNMIDTDGSGTISCAEVRALLAKTNQMLTEGEMDDLLKDVDLNFDGELSFSEFVDLMTFKLDLIEA